MAGITVTVKGTTQQTLTNDDGRFALRVTERDKALVFTYVGYQSQEVLIGNITTVSITLKEVSSILTDVVVVGYGTQRRKDITGSVGKVSVTDLQKAPVRSFEEALAGRVAGVQVTSSDGQPGASANILIRGNNSVTQQNSPLYVIDGFPIENPDNNAINPEEIESIEILKDASATAIYGARGANGVIIITTKKGKSAVPVITYDGYYGFQKVTRRTKLMNGYDFVRYLFQADSVKTRLLYLAPKGLTVDDYKNIESYNWEDKLFQRGPMQSHSLSIRGGTPVTKYSISGSAINQKGAIVNTGFKRYQGRFVLDQNISTNIKVGVNLNYSAATTFGVIPSNANNAQYNLMYNTWSYRPVSGTDNVALLEQLLDPGVNPVSDYRINPVVSAKNEYNYNFANTLITNLYGEYSITKNLTLRVSGGMNRYASRREIFNNSFTRSGSNLVTGINNVNGSVTNSNVDDYLNENTLSYNRSFKNNQSLNIVAGVTVQKTSFNQNGYSATQIPNESLGISGLDEGRPLKLVTLKSTSSLVSFLGRINYNLTSKYLFTVTMRADGSSKFSKDNRWGYFPSGAFAWRLSDEGFMKGVKAISDAKIRVSYGATGNNRVGDFSYLSSVIYNNTFGYSFNNSIVNFSQTGLLGSPALKWESTTQADVGFDLSLLNNRISFSTDYYNKKTTDLLLNADLPPTSGYANAFKNIGKVRNEGLEFTLNTNNIQGKNFSWNSSFNISFNRNRILALNDNQESILTSISWDVNYGTIPLFIAKVGQPIAQFYGYIWDGNYQYNDFEKLSNGTFLLKDNVPTNGNTRNVIQPGDIKYKDLNGDGKVDANDLTSIGSPYPTHIGGFNNNFTFYGFDFTVFLQWNYGNQAYNANRHTLEGNPAYGLNQFASYNDRWTPENQSNTYFRYGGQGPYAYSSRVLEDASFLRLKTVSLGYTISPKLLRKAKIRSVRLYTSAQNIRTWTKYGGTDPEVSTRESALTPGFDYSPYPRVFTLVFGTKIQF